MCTAVTTDDAIYSYVTKAERPVLIKLYVHGMCINTLHIRSIFISRTWDKQNAQWKRISMKQIAKRTQYEKRQPQWLIIATMWNRTYKKCYSQLASDVCDILSTWAIAFSIYGKFDTRLLEINLKFVLRSLSSSLDALVYCLFNIMR